MLNIYLFFNTKNANVIWNLDVFYEIPNLMISHEEIEKRTWNTHD